MVILTSSAYGVLCSGDTCSIGATIEVVSSGNATPSPGGGPSGQKTPETIVDRGNATAQFTAVSDVKTVDEFFTFLRDKIFTIADRISPMNRNAGLVTLAIVTLIGYFAFIAVRERWRVINRARAL